MTIGVLVLSYFVSFGYVPDLDHAVGYQTATLDDSYVATSMELGASLTFLNCLTISGSAKTFQYFLPDMFRNAPFEAYYILEISYRWRFLTIGVKHECDHPVVYTLWSADYKYVKNYTEVYIKIDGEALLS
jgi:hypothetical protein